MTKESSDLLKKYIIDNKDNLPLENIMICGEVAYYVESQPATTFVDMQKIIEKADNLFLGGISIKNNLAFQNLFINAVTDKKIKENILAIRDVITQDQSVEDDEKPFTTK